MCTDHVVAAANCTYPALRLQTADQDHFTCEQYVSWRIWSALLERTQVCQSALNFDPLSASNIAPRFAEQARRCVALI